MCRDDGACSPLRRSLQPKGSEPEEDIVEVGRLGEIPKLSEASHAYSTATRRRLFKSRLHRLYLRVRSIPAIA
ncbi:hypothetical protein MRX96_014002 [Rhipicephalus microplus]